VKDEDDISGYPVTKRMCVARHEKTISFLLSVEQQTQSINH